MTKRIAGRRFPAPRLHPERLPCDAPGLEPVDQNANPVVPGGQLIVTRDRDHPPDVSPSSQQVACPASGILRMASKSDARSLSFIA